MKWQSAYLLADILLLLVAMSFDSVPPDLAMFTALLAIWVPGIIDSKTALAGFSNSGLITVVALFIVIGGVQKMPVLSKAASWAFGKPTNARVALLKQILVVATFSVFINNTPLVAFFIPIIVDWCRTYKQNPSLYLMPLSYASIMGDLSVIGTSTSLVVQGLVTARGLPPIKFFDLALVGAPALLAGTVYLVTYGYSALSSISKRLDAKEASESSSSTSVSVEGEPRHKKGGGGGGGGSASATDYVAEVVLDKGSHLVGKPVVLNIAHIFAGDATALRILRTAKSRSSSPAPRPGQGVDADPTPMAVEEDNQSRERSIRRLTAPEITVTPSFRGLPSSPGEPLPVPMRVVAPVSESLLFCEGDRVIVRASQESLLRSYAQQGHYQFKFTAGEPHPGSRDARRYRAFKSGVASLVASAKKRLFSSRATTVEAGVQIGGEASTPTPTPSPQRAPASPPEPAPIDMPSTASSPAIFNGFEVILSNTSPLIGALVSSGVMESTYPGVTVLGVRLGMSNPHVDSFGHNVSTEVVGQAGENEVAVSVAGGDEDGRESSTFLTPPGGPTTTTNGTGLHGATAGKGPVVARSPAYDLGSITYAAGDSVLITARKDFGLDYAPGRCRDFFVVSKVAGASDIEPTGATQAGSLALLIAMFVVGSLGKIGGVPFEMEKAAMLAAGLNILFGFVSVREAYKLIQWDLAVLIGSSFGLGAAMEGTGLARDMASGIITAVGGLGPHAALFAMYGVTLFLTELISNNAAATLTIPVAINMSKQLGVNYQPFVLSICVACTAAFALPLGYQTHLMVMAPGRYTQRDFLKVGLGMDLIYWGVIAGLAPIVWNFYD